jgi:hypothetical protein
MTNEQEARFLKAIEQLQDRTDTLEGQLDGLQIKLNEANKELAHHKTTIDGLFGVLDKVILVGADDAQRLEALAMWAKVTNTIISDLMVKTGMMTPEEQAKLHKAFGVHQQSVQPQPKKQLTQAEEEALLALLKNLNPKKGGFPGF